MFERSYKVMVLLMTCFLLCTASAANAASSQMVCAQGQGTSEDAALHDAMRQAVEKQVGILLDAQTQVENAVVISDTIYSCSEGYITDYTILNKSFQNGVYIVEIKAVVSSSLNADLMSRLQKRKTVECGLQDPRIGVLITAAYDQENDSAENVIINGLQNAGFSRILDLKQIDAAGKNHITAAIFQNDFAAIQALKTQFPVDYMVAGKLENVSSGDVSSPGFNGFVNGRATMAVRMYNMNTGEIVYADTLSSVALHTSRDAAIQAAVNKAASAIVPHLTQSAMKTAANPLQHVQLFVTNDRLGNITQAQQRLSGLPGVSNVFLRDSSFGTMVFDLNYYGSSAAFAAMLETNGISVGEMSASYIKI